MTKALTPRPATPAPLPNTALVPNLFVIGASKCGTSALHAYLRLHPDVRMGQEKEPCYFVAPDDLKRVWAVMAQQPVSHDWDSYLQNFSGGETARYRGDGSTLYSMAPSLGGVPERIKAACPDARILYMVREPVKRTIGHYWQEAKEFHEKRPLAAAIRENPIYRDSSDYAKQIDFYLEHFDRSQIHVVIAERLRHQRRETMREIFDWLDLPQIEFSDADLSDRHVSPPTSRRERIPGVGALRDSALWANLRKALPTPLINALRKAGTQSFDKSDMHDAGVTEELTTYFKPSIARLEDFMGAPIPEWVR